MAASLDRNRLRRTAAAWFIEDGYEQTMQYGHPVCCGREISREWLRTGIVVVGSLVGAVLVGIGFVGTAMTREHGLCSRKRTHSL
jgi:hypothetical protein